MTQVGSEPVVPMAKKARVLLLTHRMPYPPDRGDRIRSYHLLRVLSQHFEVALGCTSEESAWLSHHQLLNTMAYRVGIQPLSPLTSKALAMQALMTGKALTPEYYYRHSLGEFIQQWHEQKPFDVVVTFCTGMIRYARLLCPPGAGEGPTGHRPRHILDLVDVDSVKWESYAKASWPPMKWVYGAEARRLRQIESGGVDRFDAITVVSEAEAKAYREHVGEHAGLTVVGNGVDLEYYQPQPDPGPENKTLVFVGVLNYKPNADAVAWFAQKVMPLLRKQVPGARFRIIGRHPTPRVVDLNQHEGVDVVGSVPDVRTHLKNAAAVVAPLRIARGIQNKVLEAMASGRVAICSPGAAEGLEAQDGEHLLVADAPEQWVGQIQRVFSDVELRRRIGAAARQRVEERYHWDRRLEPMVELIRRLGEGKVRSQK